MASLEPRWPLAGAVAGAVILADAVLARVLLTADLDRVYFLGTPIPLTCAFRRATGLPCPTCGITRSAVLTLHGNIGAAWQVMPAGPVFVLGALGFAVVLLAYAALARSGRLVSRPAARHWIMRAGLVYSAAAVLTWLGGWTIAFLTACHGGMGR